MAFNLSNNYNEANDQGDLYRRTNRLAQSGNAETLRIVKEDGADIDVVANYVVNVGANTVTATTASPTSGYTLRYYKIVISDQSGNQVANVATGTVSSVVVSTVGLNQSDEWHVESFVSNVVNLALPDKPVAFGFYIPSPSSNPTIAINSVTAGGQVLQVLGNGAVVAPAGTLALGALANGSSGQFTVDLKNTGKTTLKIANVVRAGNVLSTTYSSVYAFIYPGQTVSFTGVIDTATNGAKTGTITVTSDGVINPSYAITVTATVS